jgi:hypothetical protein
LRAGARRSVSLAVFGASVAGLGAALGAAGGDCGLGCGLGRDAGCRWRCSGPRLRVGALPTTKLKFRVRTTMDQGLILERVETEFTLQLMQLHVSTQCRVFLILSLHFDFRGFLLVNEILLLILQSVWNLVGRGRK